MRRAVGNHRESACRRYQYRLTAVGLYGLDYSRKRGMEGYGENVVLIAIGRGPPHTQHSSSLEAGTTSKPPIIWRIPPCNRRDPPGFRALSGRSSGPWPAQSLAGLELVEFGHFPVSSFSMSRDCAAMSASSPAASEGSRYDSFDFPPLRTGKSSARNRELNPA